VNLRGYRLSVNCQSALEKVARPAGLEPASPGLEGPPSNLKNRPRHLPSLEYERLTYSRIDYLGCTVLHNDRLAAFVMRCAVAMRRGWRTEGGTYRLLCRHAKPKTRFNNEMYCAPVKTMMAAK
jgi:hypothetical protein